MNEEDWNEKLRAEEADDLYDHYGPQTSQSFTQSYDDFFFGETFDEWADRIYSEFRSRKRQNTNPPSKSKAKEDQRRQPFNAEFKKKCKRLKLDKESKKYQQIDKKYAEFCDKTLKSKSRTIKLKRLPFDLSTSPDKIVSTILNYSNKDDASDNRGIRIQIRNELRRWHPDKFYQQYQDRMKACEREEIKQIITYIAQSLIKFGKKSSNV